MTFKKAAWIFVLSVAACGAVGTAIGFCLGRVIPGYYLAVFGGRSPAIDPVQVGVGLGLTQGVIAGVFVGAVLVLATALWNSRPPLAEVPLAIAPSRVPATGTVLEYGRDHRGRTAWRWAFRLLMAFGFAGTLVVGCVGGRLLENLATLSRNVERAERHAPTVQKQIAGDPRFARVEVDVYSMGSLYIYGTVQSREDLYALRQIVWDTEPPVPVRWAVEIAKATATSTSRPR